MLQHPPVSNSPDNVATSSEVRPSPIGKAIKGSLYAIANGYLLFGADPSIVLGPDVSTAFFVCGVI